MTKDKKIKYFSILCASIMTGLFATSAIAQVPRHMTLNKNVQFKTNDRLSRTGYVVGFENDLNGIEMVYDSGYYSDGSSCREKCHTHLSSKEQQWINVDSADWASASLSYNLCTSVTYEADDVKCSGWLGYVTVSLRRTENTLKPGDDAGSKSFFQQQNMQFTEKMDNLFSITSNYTPPSTGSTFIRSSIVHFRVNVPWSQFSGC